MQRNIGPTSARHASPRNESFLPIDATSRRLVLAPGYPRRASGGPSLLPAFRPLREAEKVCGKTLTETEEFTMIANALLFTIVLLLGYGFWLLDQLKFMARYKVVLYHAYGTTILIFLVVLFVNLFGAALAISRRFFLKNTGRKLSHLDKQFNVSHADMPVPVNEEDFN